jgi:hypothetical protein
MDGGESEMTHDEFKAKMVAKGFPKGEDKFGVACSGTATCPICAVIGLKSDFHYIDKVTEEPWTDENLEAICTYFKGLQGTEG